MLLTYATLLWLAPFVDGGSMGAAALVIATADRSLAEGNMDGRAVFEQSVCGSERTQQRMRVVAVGLAGGGFWGGVTTSGLARAADTHLTRQRAVRVAIC